MAGTIDPMLPDCGPQAAQQALRAADDIRVFDGRGTAWLVVQRLLEITGFAMVFGGAVLGSVLVGQWVWIAGGVGLLLLVWEGPVVRRAGAEPRRWRTRWRVVFVTTIVVALLLAALGVFGSGAESSSSGAVLPVPAVIAAWYLLAPVVRWMWSLRRPRGTTTWPDGAQAYAVLAALARVQWMHPDRLAVLTGLPQQGCDEWVRACAVRGLAVMPGRRLGFFRNAEITESGLARLDAWTAVLTERATDVPAPDAAGSSVPS